MIRKMATVEIREQVERLTDDGLVQWITTLQNEYMFLRDAVHEYVNASRACAQNLWDESARDRLHASSLALAYLLE